MAITPGPNLFTYLRSRHVFKMEPKILLKTCHVNLGVSLNIYILFEKLILPSSIVENDCSLVIKGTRFMDKARGEINNVKNNSNKKRKDFSNQCSVTGVYTRSIDFQSHGISSSCQQGASQQDASQQGDKSVVSTKVNFKVFNNGNIIITGMKQGDEEIKNALRLFLNIIIDLSYEFGNVHESWDKFIEIYNDSYAKYSKFIHNHNTQLLKLMSITQTVDIGIFDIMNNTSHPETLTTFIKPLWTDDIFKIISLFYICYYYSSKDFITNIDNPVLKNIITTNNKRIFPLSFDLKREDINEVVDKTEVVVENINAMIHFDFILDRPKFYNYVIENALNTETVHKEDNVDFISFEQTMYQGINIKYIKKDGQKTKGKPKYITFLVFQEGKILVSGSHNEQQLQEYSNKIMKLINSRRDLYEIKNTFIDIIPSGSNMYTGYSGILKGHEIKIVHYTKLIELEPRNWYIVKHTQ